MPIIDKKLCIVPFTSFSISPRGIIRPCCVIHPAAKSDMISVKSITPDIPWPTKQIQDLRNKMLGANVEENTPECKWCWTSEKSGLPSMREYMNKFWLERLGNYGFAELIANPKLNNLDLQFGHLCNLSCVMCNASFSSHMHSTKLKLAEITTTESLRARYKSDVDQLHDNVDWTKDLHSYQKVLELCKPITEIKISGGEPLFNPKFKEFLRYLIEKELPLQRIHLTTNATIYDDEIIELLNRISRVTIKLSIESTGHEEEFIRWPTNWSEKDYNIRKFVSNIKKNEFLQIELSSCMQSLNLFSFDKLSVYVSSLENPDILLKRQSVLPGDLAALWHADPNYISEFLNNPMAINEESINYINDTLLFKSKRTKDQILYFMDMAKIQGKSLKDEFPLYWQYHQQYLT